MPRLFFFPDLPEKGIRYSKAHLRRLWQAGRFPEPLYPSPRKPAWTEDQLDHWIEQLEREGAK